MIDRMGDGERERHTYRKNKIENKIERVGDGERETHTQKE